MKTKQLRSLRKKVLSALLVIAMVLTSSVAATSFTAVAEDEGNEVIIYADADRLNEGAGFSVKQNGQELVANGQMDPDMIANMEWMDSWNGNTYETAVYVASAYENYAHISFDTLSFESEGVDWQMYYSSTVSDYGDDYYCVDGNYLSGELEEGIDVDLDSDVCGVVFTPGNGSYSDTDSQFYQVIAVIFKPTSETDTEPEPEAGHVHSAGEWETTKAATCSTPGEQVQKCTECKEILATEEIPATGQHETGGDGICKGCNFIDGRFSISGINYSIDKKTTLSPYTFDRGNVYVSEEAPLYDINLDPMTWESFNWSIAFNMDNGYYSKGLLYPFRASNDNYTGSNVGTVALIGLLSTIKGKPTYIQNIKDGVGPIIAVGFDENGQFTANPVASKTFGSAEFFVRFTDKYVDPDAKIVKLNGNRVKANAVQKLIDLNGYSGKLTAEDLDKIFETTDPNYHMSGESGYTHSWVYMRGKQPNLEEVPITDAGVTYEEIQSRSVDGIFNVYVKYTPIPYRYIIDYNGGYNDNKPPVWYVGKVGDFDYGYWSSSLSNEQYNKLKDCYFGYYDVRGLGYVWYDETGGADEGAMYVENDKTPYAKLVTGFAHPNGDEENFFAYLVRPFSDGAILGSWDITYLNNRGEASNATYKASSRLKSLGNGQPQHIIKTSSSAPIYGDIIVSASYDKSQTVVFALPKGDGTFTVTAELNNVRRVGQPLTTRGQIASFTGKNTEYNLSEYDYFALLISDYNDIFLNVKNGYYIADRDKALYLDTPSGKVYLTPISGTTGNVNGSARYHLTRDASGAAMREDFKSAWDGSNDGVVYVRYEENAVKSIKFNVYENLQVYTKLETGTSNYAGMKYQYCSYSGKPEGQYFIKFYDAAGNEKTNEFSWGEKVRFKIVDENGKDASGRIRVFYNNTPRLIKTVAASTDKPVITGFNYYDFGVQKLTNTTLSSDNEIYFKGGYYSYDLNYIISENSSGTKMEETVYLDILEVAAPGEEPEEGDSPALKSAKVNTAKEVVKRAHLKFDISTVDDIEAAYDDLKAYYDEGHSNNEYHALSEGWASGFKQYYLFRYYYNGVSPKKISVESSMKALKTILDGNEIDEVREVYENPEGEFRGVVDVAFADCNAQYIEEWKEKNTITAEANYENEVTNNGYTVVKTNSTSFNEITPDKPNVAVDMSKEPGLLQSVVVSVDDLKKVEENFGTLTIKTRVGSVEFSADAIKNIANSAALAGTKAVNESTGIYFNLISVSGKDLYDENGNEIPGTEKYGLTENQKKVISSTGKPVIDLTITTSRGATVPLNDTSVTVTVPYEISPDENPEHITVWYINNIGRVDHVEGSYDENTKMVTFTTTHFSAYVAVEAVTKQVWVKD